MPERPEQLWERAHDELRMPPLDEWETFPFDGAMRPRPLAPPDERDRPREGEHGVDCHACDAADDEYVWTDERWRLRAYDRPALPVIVLLEPRAHYADPGDLPDDLAADLGLMLARVERAVRAVPNVGRVHVCRWGDGSEHLHWWFMARPERFAQLIGSFAAIWEDVLPPLPEDVWRENLALVVAALEDATS